MVTYEKQAAPEPPQKKRDLKEMLGLSGTEKKVVIGCLAILIVLLLAITASALVCGESSKQVKIVITTTGNWTLNYGASDNMTAQTGVGNTTVVYTRAVYENTVLAYLYSYSGQEATLQIVSMDGAVLAETTSSGYFLQAQWTP